MNKTIILLLATVMFASAMESTLMEHYSFAFKSRRSIMMVMTQVEEQLRTNGPMDAITNILNNFEKEIKEEQVSHQELFDRQTDECDSEIEFRNKEIKSAEDAIAEASNTLESCQGQKGRAENDLKNAEGALSNARTSLGTLNRQKIQQDYSFETFITASNMALEGFPECYRLLDELDNGNNKSLLELTSHVTKMVPVVARTNMIAHMNPVMTALATISSAAAAGGANDKAALEKVRSVLVGLEDQTRRKKEQAIEENAKFQAFFTKTEQKLKNDIERLTNLISELQDEIADLNNCIAVQQANLSSAKNKLSRNTSLRNKADAMCQAMKEQFEKATQSRKDELELLGAIKIKVIERYAQISKGAQERGEMSGEELAKYDELEYEKKSFGK